VGFDVTIRIAGEAGQGIQTIGFSFCRMIKNCGWNLLANQEYMSRVRGGDRMAAYQKAGECGERIPLGVIYRNEKPCFEEKIGLNSLKPLIEYEPDEVGFEEIMKAFA
jgi:hypothetical protein